MSEEVKVIGIDTNILVRIITRDDEKQSQIALDYVSNIQKKMKILKRKQKNIGMN